MHRFQLFLFSILFNISLISTLCYSQGLPLIFPPIDYGPKASLHFVILIVTLSFLFVYIQIPWLKWFWSLFIIKKNPKWYYLIGNLLFLQLLTMIYGYFESSGDFFFLYKCVSNSCIYILSGNLSVVLISILYAKEEYRKMRIEQPKFGEN